MIASIAEIGRHEGASVTVRGWLHNRRSSGKIHFLSVRDGSGFIQAVVSKATVGEEKFKQARPPVAGNGAHRPRHGARRQPRPRRLRARRLRLRDRERLDRLSDHAEGARRRLPARPAPPLDPLARSRRRFCACATRSISAVRDFFNDRGFILADTPIFTPAACEGTTTLFPVDYFEDQKVYLTQSGQLYAEANAMALGRVYNFGPVFRAEKSKTRRHLTEFWMVEPEMAYATLDDVIDLAEGLVVAVVSRVLETARLAN